MNSQLIFNNYMLIHTLEMYDVLGIDVLERGKDDLINFL